MVPTLKLTLNTELANYINNFSLYDEVSLNEMLNRLLCIVSDKNSLRAAQLLYWYFTVTTTKLSDEQIVKLVFTMILSLISCMIDYTMTQEEVLEVLLMCCKDVTCLIIEKDNIIKSNRIYEVGEIEVCLRPEALKFINHKKKTGMTIEETLLEIIKELIPTMNNMALVKMLQYFMDVTKEQNKLQVDITILILSSMLLFCIAEVIPIRKIMTILADGCTENIKNDKKYKSIKKLKDLIYRCN